MLGTGKRDEAAGTTSSWVDRVLTGRTAPKDSAGLSALPWTSCAQRGPSQRRPQKTRQTSKGTRVSLFPKDRSRQLSRRASGSRRLQPWSRANRTPHEAFQCRSPLHGCLLPREGHGAAHSAAAPDRCGPPCPECQAPLITVSLKQRCGSMRCSGKQTHS